jgi:hypothetical protein
LRSGRHAKAGRSVDDIAIIVIGPEPCARGLSGPSSFMAGHQTHRPPRDEKRSKARRVYLTWRATESIELTEALAAGLEVELVQFAKDLRALH